MTTALADPPTSPTKKERPTVWPEMIVQSQVYGRTGYTGIPRANWFRSKAAGKTPKAIRLPGGGIYYRRADLDKWIAGLKAS